MMRATWIGGWGVDPRRMEPAAVDFLPGAEHVFLPPVGGAAVLASQSDWVLGWSLGAWCLLAAAAAGAAFRGRVVLLAPFAAFCSEDGMGGLRSRSQVRWLRRWLERAPLEALGDFYLRAGLGLPPQDLPYPIEDLRQGLDWLEAGAPPELRRWVARGLPANYTAFIGGADPLLDAAAVSGALPGCRILPEVGHGFQALLAGMRQAG